MSAAAAAQACDPAPELLPLDGPVLRTVRSSIAISSIWQAVEECVANSLDAGATEVCVEVAAAEFAFKVADNGAGITLDNLELLGVRHATSKCGSTSRGARALGGRGEALAAIAETAVTEVASRARGCFETYSALLRGGSILKIGLALDQRACPGTAFRVRDLLFNRPVMRTAIIKHGLGREVERCCEAVARLALARPHVTFTLYDKQRKAFLLKKIKGRPQVDDVYRFFGHPPPGSAAAVQPQPGTGCAVRGWAAMPPHGHPTTARQWLYVNGRFARAPAVSELVDDLFAELYKPAARLDAAAAAQQQLQAVRRASNRHAMFVLQLECLPGDVDLAPEPEGAAALFRDREGVLEAVRAAVTEAWRPALRSAMLASMEGQGAAEGGGTARPPGRRSTPARRGGGCAADFDPTIQPVGRQRNGAAYAGAKRAARSGGGEPSRSLREVRPRSSLGQGAPAGRQVAALGNHKRGGPTTGGRGRSVELEDGGEGRDELVLGMVGPAPLQQLPQWQGLAAAPRERQRTPPTAATLGLPGSAPAPPQQVGVGSATEEGRCDSWQVQAAGADGGRASSGGGPAARDSAALGRGRLGGGRLDAILSSWRNPCMLPPAAAGSAAPAPILTLAAAEAEAFARLRPAALSHGQLLAARALRQVDAKFVVVVGGGVVSAVDQHAADERVQLERLRRQLVDLRGRPAAQPAPALALSTPQPLGLAGAEVHMLEAWGPAVHAWGWRWACAGHAGASLAVTQVPVVCGTALTATDLRLYLHQLEETGGAAGAPAGVIRVLNSKACRGAIMFGDGLLPAQCQALVAALKRTQLCFVCAHGRPTTAPLVDLRALRRVAAVRGAGREGGARGAPPLAALKGALLRHLAACT